MKTIRSWGLAALSLLILTTSCEEERIETNQDRKNISFGLAVGKQTISKATEFKYWATDAGFTVHSYIPNVATPEFQAFNLVFKGSSSTDNTNWTIDPDNVKQPGFALNYFAYYPVTEGYASDFAYDGTDASFSYIVGGTDATGDQEDLIAATTTTIEQQVTLTFNHLLSQVNFALQGMPNVQIEVKNIQVNSVYSTGDYTFNEENGGSWAQVESAFATYGYTPITNSNKTDGTDGDISYMGNGGSTYTNSNALMLLPQDFSSNTGATISFDYILKDMSGAAIGNTSDAAPGSTSVYLSDFSISKWEMGKRYLYLIDFSSYLESGYITFKVTVNDWEEGGISVNPVAQTLEVAQPNLLSIEKAIDEHATFNLSAKYTPDGEEEEVDVLKIFPISLSVAPTADITIKNIPDKFDAGDAIKIYCKSNAGAQFIKLDNSLSTLWSLTPAAASTGTVVTLTRTTTPYPEPTP